MVGKGGRVRGSALRTRATAVGPRPGTLGRTGGCGCSAGNSDSSTSTWSQVYLFNESVK